MNTSEPGGGGALPPAPASVDAIPPRTTPTWEMELLLSGATVFALLQLLGFLDERYFRAFATFSSSTETLWLLLYVYLRSAVLILAVAFILHLCLRAHWVALVGVRSVFPHGVRIEGLRGGPNARAVTQERLRDVALAIERADNRATMVFGMGVGLAFSIVMPGVVVLAASSLAWLIHLLPGQSERLPDFFIAIVALLFAPLMLATAIDGLVGRRIASDAFVARSVRRIMRGYGHIGLSQNANALYAIFSSNFGALRSASVVMVLMFAAFGATIWGFYRAGDPGAAGAPGYWPQRLAGSSRALYAEHYADQRRAHPLTGSIPFIPALEVGGDWLSLTVPLRPRLHNDVMERDCPEAARTTVADPAAQDRQRATLLDCVASLHAVKLDGQPVEGVTWDFFERPGDGLRGVLAMVPIAGLAPGRHELELARPGDRPRGDAARTPRAYRIPFWRIAERPDRSSVVKPPAD